MPLSASTVMQLNNSMVDAGANFLVGAATNPFSDDFNDKQAGLMSVVGGAMGAASGAANIVGSGIQNAALTATIVTEGIADLQMQLTEYVAQSTVKLMTIPMDKFAKAMQDEISDETFKPKEIIESLTKGAEEFQKGVAEEMQKIQQQQINSTATSKVAEISATVTKWLKTAQDEMNTIASYTAKGPEWMQDKIDKYSYTIMTQVSGQVDKVVADFDTIKNDWAESAGKSAGQKVVQPINKKLVDAQKSIIDKIEEVKLKAMTKAKAAVAQGIMKLKGLLGG